MGSIRIAIELQDNFSHILYQMMDSVNLGMAALEDLHQTMSAPVDTSSMEAARDSISQTAIAVRELDEVMQEVGASGPAIPDVPAEPSIADIVAEPATANVEAEPATADVPVESSLAWRSDGIEVFTGSGTERFVQEIQSANDMLDTLHLTQAQIADNAAQSDLFPPGMAADMEDLAARIGDIQEQMEAIEDYSLYTGTDVANTEMEHLRTQLDQAVQEQEELNRAVENMDVGAANDAYLRLSRTVGGTQQYLRDNVDEQGRFNSQIEAGKGSACGLMKSISQMVEKYATWDSVSAVMEMSDQFMLTTMRLDRMNDGLQTTQELQDMVYLAAQRSRSGYQETADAVAQLGTNAGSAFSGSGETVAFAEQLNKQFAIAGLETDDKDAAMQEMTQVMASGVFDGNAYESMLGQVPGIIEAIADYMGVPQEKLQAMANEGVISAEIVKQAMFAAADESNAKLASMPMTFSQIGQAVRDAGQKLFWPVLEQVNELGNSEAFLSFVGGIIQGLAMVAGLAVQIFELLAGGVDFIAENWSRLSPIIYGVAAALAVYYGWQLALNAIGAVSEGIHAALATAQTVHAVATGALTGATAADTAAQHGLNAAILACPIFWIIMLIIALIAIFYAVIAEINKFAGTSLSATGIIAGAFAVLFARIMNTFVVPIFNILATLANFFGNVFHNPVAAVKVLFFDMCLAVIGYIRNLAGAIETLLNKIPGVTVDITSGLDEFYAGLEEAREAVKDESGWEEYVEKMDYRDYEEAAKAGYSFGEGIEDKVKNFDPASLFGDGMSGGEEYFKEFDPASLLGDDMPGEDEYPPLEDYGADIGNGVNEIAGNTGAMADSMEITGEELKYLRDIAEQEAINRFTTADIRLEQVNHNTIKNGMDLDGVLSGLDDLLGEAGEIMTEGVHV